MAVATFQRGDDGLFHCDVPGCEQPGYEHPQHLGLHRFHKHGIKGEARKNPPGHLGRPRKDGTPPRQRKNRHLSAEDVCLTVLESIAPGGSIPVNALSAYAEWVRQTETFLNKLMD